LAPRPVAITHHVRGTVIPIIRRPGSNRFQSTQTPLERFRKYCQFDATTGCVLWIGGVAMGRGKSAPYGSFWAEGRRWFAHRWAAHHIHGLDIEGMHVDHCCEPWRAGGTEPLLPNTLCVQHVQAKTNRDNVMLAHERRKWVLTQKGYYEPPPLFAELQAPAEYHAVPMHVAPAGLGLDSTVNSADEDCPF
jgi:hypothetical protein